MAIFRAGKRIGPFDIRMGFPRDKSMDNIDGDVRLRQHANTENTIGRFRSMMARAEGYARPARFAVKLFLPTNLKKMANAWGSGDDYEDQTTTIAHPNHRTMQQLATQMDQQINIHCHSITMPGHDLNTETITDSLLPREVVTGHGYKGKITASFYADKYLRERTYLELWQKLAANTLNHKVGYYNNYVGKMHIYQLGSLDGYGDRDVPTYGVECIDVYPETLSGINYEYSSKNQVVKVSVEFQYRMWHNLATDKITGIDFGASQQKLHPPVGQSGGFLGKLPPELRRAIGGVINQAKTQLPIGRLTKGKIFPPFTT
jgi:hypothetical protein